MREKHAFKLFKIKILYKFVVCAHVLLLKILDKHRPCEIFKKSLLTAISLEVMQKKKLNSRKKKKKLTIF